MSDLSELIRSNMPVVTKKVYLNTGSVGPMSHALVNAMRDYDLMQMNEGRGVISAYFAFKEEVPPQIREHIGKIVGADSSTIALTHHTTDGMNIAVNGIDWQAGDEVITTNMEHPGGYMPVYLIRQRYGVTLKVVNLGWQDTPEEIVEKFAQAITPRTRALVFSHVVWNTGGRYPLKEICDLARAHKLITIADAAQSAGAIPLDLPASGVDFYAMPGQKWLGGPEGVGALYVNPDRLSETRQTFAGYASLEPGAIDRTGNFIAKPDASRFEVGSINRSAMVGWLAHMQWVSETAGWEWVYQRTAALKTYACDKIGSVPKATILTPDGDQAGLTTFVMDGYDPDRVVAALEPMGIVIRSIKYPHALRVAAGFYNNEEDIDTLCDALSEIATVDPDSLPHPEH